MNKNIPKEILDIIETIQNAKFEAYLIGGCVRDLLREQKPKDWDITTSAKPEEIEGLFEDTFYENDYGTVGVVNKEVEDETLRIIEVTPYRIEGKYVDGRRPEEVHFSDKLEDDLKRRDFAMNAIAYNPAEEKIVDLYNGQEDIKNKIIKTVGEPGERFAEDYLRMMRAVRLATELDFEIDQDTKEAIIKHADSLPSISTERIRDEFVKIISSSNPMKGILALHELGLLKHIAPEIEEGVDIDQSRSHIYNVWEHNLRALQHSADRNYKLEVRLAALLHDVAKPATRRYSKEKDLYTFYGHDVVGARMTKKLMERLRFSREQTDTVVKLVRNHLFFTDIDAITLSAVRRIIRNVGAENVWNLIELRTCDRIGMGRPKEEPYRLRKYESMIEEAMRAPVSVGMLKIDGIQVSEIAGGAGPRVGWILHALLEDVLDDPELNTEEYLNNRAQEFAKMSGKELKELGEKGREKKEEEEEKELGEIRKKYKVK
ncbi:CCA tRNA nucleotidyltransferase [Patescibacteria group bacterium]